MPNPGYRGEFAYLYYQITDYDTSAADATILADASWVELCIIDADENEDTTLNEVADRCTGQVKAYTGGKTDFSLSINLNELRISDAVVRAWDAALDGNDIIAFLKLDSERTDTSNLQRGWVGNFIKEGHSKSQPYEDNISRALSFKLAAKSDYTPLLKKVYGSSVT